MHRLLKLFLFLSALFSVCSANAQTNDFNGDGREEFLLWQESTGIFTAVDRNGVVISNPVCGQPGDIPLSGDLGPESPHQGRSVAMVFRPGNFPQGGRFLICSDDGSLSPFHPNGIPFGQNGDQPLLRVDFNGDGISDPTLYRRQTGEWFQIIIGSGASSAVFGGPDEIPVPGDYDGDGKTDLATYKLLTGEWRVRLSSSNRVRVTQWGLPSDIPVPGDYEGDGKTDLAVWRPDTGEWLIIPSSNTNVRFRWILGIASDQPIQADVNGDNRTDIAVFRPSTGEIFFDETQAQRPANRIVLNVINHRVPHSTVRRRATNDFNGDGVSDYAVVRQQGGFLNWFGGSGSGNQIYFQSFGVGSDEWYARDFDGDGLTDIGIVRPLNGSEAFWTVRLTGSGSVISTLLGASGDYIVPGDYDNDRKADFAIAREDARSGLMNWFIRSSASGRLISQSWGLVGDTPVQGDFNGDGLLDPTVVRNSGGQLIWYPLSYDPFALDNVEPRPLEIVAWGLAGDILAPADYDGDGYTDHAVVRDFGGQLLLLIRGRDGRALPPIPWGLTGDSVVPGNYRGGLGVQTAVWRPGPLADFLVNQGLGLASAVRWGLRGDTPVSPIRIARIPGGTDGPISTIACDETTDFVDGGGGKLWKPVSDNTGSPVILMPRIYWTTTDSIEVFGANGEKVLDGQRRTCCPNGNRAHYDVFRRATALRENAPLIVRFNRTDGTRECHEVEDPVVRYD